MRIDKVEAFALRAPIDDEPYWGARSWGEAAQPEKTRFRDPPAYERFEPAYEATCSTLLVRVETNTGVTGWGEAKAPVVPEVTREVVHRLLVPQLLGADPRDLQPIWDSLFGRMWLRAHSTGFLLEAIAAVDIALWDVVARLANTSVSSLLGGRYRERIPVYASGVVGLRDGADDEERVGRAVAAFADEGYRGVKVAIGHGVDLDVRSLRTARAALPPDCALLADAAARYDLAQAQRLLHGLSDLDVFWLEAPLPPEARDGYAILTQTSRTPIAIDLLGNRFQVLDFLRDGAAHIIQPDVSRAGGLTEARRIAHLADTFGVRCVPHMSLGSVVHVAASAHFAASLPELPLMEYWAGQTALNSLKVGACLRPDSGELTVPNGPGLGIEIDEDSILSYTVA